MKIIIVIFAFLFYIQSGIAFAQEAKKEEAKAAAPASEAGKPAESAAVVVPPVIQIKPLEGKDNMYSLELRNVEIGDLFRVLAHDYKLNLLVDQDLRGQVTASLSNVTLEQALTTIAESQNLILEKKDTIIKVRPNLITKAFTLRHIEAKKLLEFQGTQSQPAGTQSTTTATIYDLLSPKGRIFLGSQLNSLMVIDYPTNLKKIEEFVKIIDQKLSTKVYKLKYMKAADVVGATTVTSTTTQSSTEQGTTVASTTTATTTQK